MTIVSTHDGRGFSKIGVGRGGEGREWTATLRRRADTESQQVHQRHR